MAKTREFTYNIFGFEHKSEADARDEATIVLGAVLRENSLGF